MNDIPLKPGIEVSIFAGDIAFWYSDSDPDTLTSTIQNYVNDIEEWAHWWGFKISSEKTQAIIFTNKRKAVEKKINICNQEINYSDFSCFWESCLIKN